MCKKFFEARKQHKARIAQQKHDAAVTMLKQAMGKGATEAIAAMPNTVFEAMIDSILKQYGKKILRMVKHEDNTRLA